MTLKPFHTIVVESGTVLLSVLPQMQSQQLKFSYESAETIITLTLPKMDKRQALADRLSKINPEGLFSIAQSARILGVGRSYLYYCFSNNPDFPKPVLKSGRRWLLGKDLHRIVEIRSFNGL